MPLAQFGVPDYNDYTVSNITGTVNHPGVSQSSWSSCFSCSNTLNQCTKVSGSPNATDQFSLYRGNCRVYFEHACGLRCARTARMRSLRGGSVFDLRKVPSLRRWCRTPATPG